MRKNSTKIKKRKLDESPVCYVCQDGTFYILELHHVLPIKSGGSDCDENTELLCPNCHAYLHFIITDRANGYFREDVLISDMIRCYKNSDIVVYRMRELLDRWIFGLEQKIDVERRERERLEAENKELKESESTKTISKRKRGDINAEVRRRRRSYLCNSVCGARTALRSYDE